ncbi:hypothetical protein [Desulfomonile tiedjei]|uniref:Roadblock/LC7 domain-containing protein n=1 Tax=Desulfomonile tiedjei (strain ATCC 49306 / DSM 6799 / DCB-1) TaxID=706587 RepID=I4C7C3_DESTA|nr:hypothetical protein [Desulfomonile tiedjei]AFM25464.1 hypothetical protein Desti_2793 [Desulfomonile tiedjei DSM 6799]
MIVFDEKIQDALDTGLALQIVLADSDGFVLDNGGYVFDPDQLVALFMSTQRQMQEGAVRFDFGQISEFSFCLTGTELTVACRRIFWPDGGCVVIVVLPVGGAQNIIIADVIRAFGKYVEDQRAALRNS